MFGFVVWRNFLTIKSRHTLSDVTWPYHAFISYRSDVPCTFLCFSLEMQVGLLYQILQFELVHFIDPTHLQIIQQRYYHNFFLTEYICHASFSLFIALDCFSLYFWVNLLYVVHPWEGTNLCVILENNQGSSI